MIKNILKGWNMFEIIWISLFSVVAIVLAVLWKETLFGFGVFITGVFCVVLTAKGSLWSFVFGLFNTLGYAYIAYMNHLYGEMGLNLLFFLPTNIMGFLLWKKHMTANKKVEMRRLRVPAIIAVVFICITGSLALGFVLSLIPSQNTPYIDAITNIISIVATILTMWRYREQWLLYIVLNSFTIALWGIRTVNGGSDGILMIVMWSAYFVNAIYGYYNWSRRESSSTKSRVTNEENRVNAG